jgi:hypothetical protein
MAYSEFLADRIRQRLASQYDVVEKKMMGGLIFMVNGKMCVGVDFDKKEQEDRLMARIGKEAYAAALAEKGVREMDFTGKVMRGFVFISPAGFDADIDLDFWVEKALQYNAEVKEK